MRAAGMLNILKACEKAFGSEGREKKLPAINKAGYEAADVLLDNSTFFKSLDEIDLISYYLTALNLILYPSLVDPWITSPDRCESNIRWCPAQDMIRVLRDIGPAEGQGPVEELIPSGAIAVI